ncbi:MAG TPA: AtpZ/AtpI family protein [Bacteroidia bacterium]|nr:AtpZ/AtpI family protein [Bacteroidia bacterium]HNT80748.1 AtpZ/AtpI family protein [Bacteroidia bacterium]
MKNKTPNSRKKQLEFYARYSAMGIQMAAIIFLLTFFGVKCDQWLSMSFPLFTIVFSLLSVVAALYVTLKDLFKSK